MNAKTNRQTSHYKLVSFRFHWLANIREERRQKWWYLQNKRHDSNIITDNIPPDVVISSGKEQSNNRVKGKETNAVKTATRQEMAADASLLLSFLMHVCCISSLSLYFRLSVFVRNLPCHLATKISSLSVILKWCKLVSRCISLFSFTHIDDKEILKETHHFFYWILEWLFPRMKVLRALLLLEVLVSKQVLILKYIFIFVIVLNSYTFIVLINVNTPKLFPLLLHMPDWRCLKSIWLTWIPGI